MPQSRSASLFHELRRRHVFKVAAVYAVVAWLVLQVVALVFPALRLPPWTVTLVVVIALIGFPLALVLAWALELTPDGIRPTPPLPDQEEPPPADQPERRGRVPHPAAPAAPPAQTLAVIPLANLSADPENEYFSDGVTEELIDVLGRVAGLRVASRTSSFALKGRGGDVRRVAQELGVFCVLEGGIRRAGSRLRVTVQLAEADSGLQLWSGRYDRELTDVFAVQEEIAREVAAALELHLLGGEAPRLVRPATGDPEAHDLYLRGRYHLQRRTRGALQRAVEHFDRAIERDPRFALAHAGRAEAYTVLWDYGFLAPRVARTHAGHAARDALRLDPGCLEAATTLAVVDQLDREFAASEGALRRILQRHPRHSAAHHRLALLLTWTGRHDEARAQIGEARRLEPLSPVVQATVGWVEYFARRYDAASAALRAALEMEPHHPLAHLLLGRVRLAEERPAEAVESFLAALEGGGETPAVLGLLAHATGAAGDAEAAERLIQGLRLNGSDLPPSPYHLALAHLGLDQRRPALSALADAERERDPALVLLGVDPLLDPVRDEEEVRGITRSLGLAPAPVPLAR